MVKYRETQLQALLIRMVSTKFLSFKGLKLKSNLLRLEPAEPAEFKFSVQSMVWKFSLACFSTNSTTKTGRVHSTVFGFEGGNTLLKLTWETGLSKSKLKKTLSLKCLHRFVTSEKPNFLFSNKSITEVLIFQRPAYTTDGILSVDQTHCQQNCKILAVNFYTNTSFQTGKKISLCHMIKSST